LKRAASGSLKIHDAKKSPSGFLMLLEVCRYMIEQCMHGGDGLAYLPKSCPFPWGSGPIGGQCKMAESNEMPFRGLTRAGSRNNVLVG